MEKQNSVCDLWGTIKQQSIHILGIPEGVERQNDSENIFSEIKTKNFSNLDNEMDNQVQEAHRIPYIQIRGDLQHYTLYSNFQNKNTKKFYCPYMCKRNARLSLENLPLD